MTGPELPLPVRIRSFLRSFTVQGSWNYRTMLGNGMAFSLLPVLRTLYTDPDELQAAVGRHVELFNAHPYLTSVGLGAVTRLEQAGEDPETIRRFKAAIRGPLGGLGDALIWAAWLPVTLLVGLLLGWLGPGPAVAVPVFLVLYNAGHLGLRVWGYRIGLRDGREVGRTLRLANLGGKAERVGRLGTFLAAVLTGVILVSGVRDGPEPWLWVALASLALGVGMVRGHRAWRPAALAVVATVLLLLFVPFSS